MANTTFDMPGYIARMGLLIDKAYLEYRHLATDTHMLQCLYLRVYLMVSGLLAAFEVSAIIRFKAGELAVASGLTVPVLVLVGLSLLLALTTFTVCLDTLRGRRNLEMALGDFKFLADKAFREAQGDSDALFYQTVLVSIGAEITRQAASANRRGKTLRAISWMLLCALALAALAGGVTLTA